MKFRRQSTRSRKNNRRHKKQFGWVPVRDANSLGRGSILGHQRLEERIVLAWDTTLGLAASANVSTNVAGTTTTFTAVGNGANVSWGDVETQLANGFNVVINTGSTGTQAGNITDQTGAILGGLASNVSLSFESGSGAGLVGNISLGTETLGGTDDSFIIDAAGSATSTGAGALTATNLTVTAAAGITLNTSVSNLTATDNTSGDISITQASLPAQALTVTGTGVVNNTGTGTIDVTNLGSSITVDGGSAVKSSNGGITLAATGLTLTGTVSSDTARTVLTTSQAAEPIDLGSTPANTLGLTSADLDNVTAGVLQIGSPASGAINVSAAIAPTGTSTLTLVNGDAITEAAVGSLKIGSLSISSTGPVTLSKGNDVGTLGASTTGAFTFSNGTNTLAIGSVDGNNGVVTTNSLITLTAGDLNIDHQVKAGTGGVSLNASGAVTIDSTVSGTSPTLTGGTSLLVDYTAGASLPQGLGFSTTSAGASLTLSDSAGAAADTYDITDSGVTRDGATPVTYSGIAKINVTGSNNNDTLTVDNTGGLIAPTINFTGGMGTNSLIVTGNAGAGVSAVYNDTGSDPTGFSGNVTSTQSATTETIDFTGLSPMEFLTPTSLLTINMAAGATVENIVAGPTSTGIDPILGTTAPTYQVNYGGGGEPINWRNATTVDVVGSTSADTITENLPTQVDAGSPNQLTTLNIDANGTTGGGIVDEIDVLATPSGVTTNTDDKAANLNLRVVVGSTLGTFDNGTGTLAKINGAINATDSGLVGGGTGALLVDDSGGTGPDTATVTSTTITVGSHPAIGYDSTIDEAIELALTAKADTFNVQSTNAGVATTILLGNAGDDTFNVSSTAPAVNGDGTLTGNLSGIKGQLDIRGDAGTNTLNVSDYSGPSGQTYGISILVATITQVTATGSAHILYNNGDPSDIANLNLTGSSAGGNTYNIGATTATTQTNVEDGDSLAGAGGSTFNINGANLTAANTFDGNGGHNIFNVTNSLVAPATLNIDGGSGTNQLNVPSADFITPTGPSSGKVGTTAGGNDVVTTFSNIADTLTPVGTLAISDTEGTTFASTALATFTTSYTANVASHFSATIDWGDGTSSAGTVSGTGNGTLTVSGSHLYTDELAGGAPSVALNENAPGTATATATGTANVADADTLATVGTVAISDTEGTTFASTALATFTTTYTANSASDFSATINWGDGTSSAGTVSGTGNGTLTVSGSHLYTDELAAGAVSVVLSDNAPGTATATATGTANVADADVLQPVAATISATENTTFTGTVATFTNTGYPANAASDFAATINWGDGTTGAGTVSGTGNGTLTVSGSHLYSDELASAPISVTLSDNAPGTATATASGTANVADADVLKPVAATISATENATFSGAVATFTNAGYPANPASDFSAVINWGDGTSSAGTVSGTGNGTLTVSGGHLYSDELASAPMSVTLSDNAPGTATATATGTANVADADVLQAGAPAAFTVTQLATLSGTLATFTNTGYPGNSASDFTATINWGDGTSSTGTVSLSNGTLSVEGSHVYAAHGADTVTVVLADDAPGTASATATAAVTVFALPFLAGVPGDGTPQTFVHNLYRELLGREPDSAGDSFWVNYLSEHNNAAGRAQAIQAFMNSPEYASHYITILYQVILGRAPDASGLQFWTAKMGSPGTPGGATGSADEKAIVAAFFGSDEFFIKSGNTAQGWINALYEDILGRAPDASGAAFWANELATRGAGDRDGIVRDLLTAPEAEHLVLDSFYPAPGGTSTHPLAAPGSAAGTGLTELAIITGAGWENLYLEGPFDSQPEGNDSFFAALAGGAGWDDVQLLLLQTSQFYTNPNRPVTL